MIGGILIKLNLVLVSPQIPQNTGNIARTCSVTGASLHIIHPIGFTITDKHLKRAGLDYWNLLDLHEYASLDEFFKKQKGSYYFFTTKAKHTYTDVSYPDNVFLFFGREDQGLPEALLAQYYDNCVRIPMIANEGARSLNLSNSVAIAAYEVLRQWNFPSLNREGSLTTIHPAK